MWALGVRLCFLLTLAAQVDSNGTWCYDSQDPKCGENSSNRLCASVWPLLAPVFQRTGHQTAGPAHWKELVPACGGPTQSPINIDLGLAQRDDTLKPFIFHGYDSAPQDPWILENDGHTVVLRVRSCQRDCPAIRGAGLPSPEYRLLQLHFHWGSPGHKGSEHSVDEKHGSMEMHMVHMNTKYQSMGDARRQPDGLAILAVLLLEEDKDNTNFSAIVSGLKNVSSPGVSVNLTSTFALASLLPSALGLLRYYRYSGSLTTPGCEPAVLWTVFENTVPIGHAQVGATAPPPRPGSFPRSVATPAFSACPVTS